MHHWLFGAGSYSLLAGFTDTYWDVWCCPKTPDSDVPAHLCSLDNVYRSCVLRSSLVSGCHGDVWAQDDQSKVNTLDDKLEK